MAFGFRLTESCHHFKEQHTQSPPVNSLGQANCAEKRDKREETAWCSTPSAFPCPLDWIISGAKYLFAQVQNRNKVPRMRRKFHRALRCATKSPGPLFHHLIERSGLRLEAMEHNESVVGWVDWPWQNQNPWVSRGLRSQEEHSLLSLARREWFFASPATLGFSVPYTLWHPTRLFCFMAFHYTSPFVVTFSLADSSSPGQKKDIRQTSLVAW